MKQRIITAIVALAVFVPIVMIGGMPFTALMYLLATIGVVELLNMKKSNHCLFPALSVSY